MGRGGHHAPAADLDAQQLFLDLLDRFTRTHLRLLKLLSEPTGWFDRHGIAPPDIGMGRTKSQLIMAAMPELAGRLDLLDRYGGALTSAGLISQSLSGIMTANGVWAAATSALGVEFLAFVADPESKVA